MMRYASLAAIFLFAGCETTIRVQNNVPGARVENARWIPDGDDHTFEAIRVLEPGEVSNELLVPARFEGASGPVHFELVVRGNRVALVTDPSFTAHTDQSTTFRLERDAEVTNPALEALGDADD